MLLRGYITLTSSLFGIQQRGRRGGGGSARGGSNRRWERGPGRGGRGGDHTRRDRGTGEGGQAEAIAPTTTVEDQPHWPPAPALDEVYALEVATSEAAALVPDAGMLPT